MGHIPPYLSSIFQRNNEIHSHNTRSSGNVHLINPKLTLAQRTIRHYGPEVWLSIPTEIKQRTLLSSFKTGGSFIQIKQCA